MMIEPIFLTADEAAALLRVSRDVIYKLVKSGRIKPIPGLTRHHRFEKSQLLTELMSAKDIGDDPNKGATGRRDKKRNQTRLEPVR